MTTQLATTPQHIPLARNVLEHFLREHSVAKYIGALRVLTGLGCTGLVAAARTHKDAKLFILRNGDFVVYLIETEKL